MTFSWPSSARWPSWLPRGGSLPDAAWHTRHRAVMALLWAHVALVPVYAVYQGNSVLHAWVDTAPVVMAAIVAGFARLGRGWSSSIAALGLVVCSGVIVHLSGGMIEAHFHFFVMIPVIALYEAWAPFGLAVAYVLVHHGVMGTLSPRTVFNTPAAYERPWLFASVHAAFFAFACIACVVNWRLHEKARLVSQTQTQLLTTIVDSLAEGLVVVDEDDHVLLRNPAGLALLGRTPDDPPDADPVEDIGLFHPDGRPVTAAELPHVQALAGISVSDLDLLVRNHRVPEGRVLNFSAIPLAPGDAHDARAVVVVFRDMTERHRTEQALTAALATEQDAVERLRELERVKSDFVSTVSHELRTPLTSIIGYVEMLTDGMVGELDRRQLDVLGRVDRNSQRLMSLVEDLLRLSQIEASSDDLEVVRTDLRDVVASAREAIGGILDGRTLDVRLDLPAHAVELDADPDELERMLVNLLGNAVKFTPDGGSVHLRLTGDEPAVLVIEDTGIGIPADEQDQLFTRFFRSTTATERAVQGTGLGLTIVRAVLDLHGGSIDVESEVDRGTTVTVRLPRSTEPRTEPRAEVA